MFKLFQNALAPEVVLFQEVPRASAGTFGPAEQRK